MKRALRLSVLILGLLASFGAYADQFALPWGWTGGYGVLGQCLLSNGPATLPSWQACPGGGGSGTVTSVAAGTGLTGGTITSTGTIALSTPIADGSLSTNVALLNASNTFTGALTTFSNPVSYTFTAGGGSGPLQVKSAGPTIEIWDTSAATDAKRWELDGGQAAHFRWYAISDSGGANTFLLDVTRSGANITDIKWGNTGSNPTTEFQGTGLVTFSGISKYLSGQVDQIRVVTAAGAITAATTDRHICVNKTTGAASAVSLFATPTAGTLITVDDCKGDAATNNITVTPAAGNIDGSTTFVINANYGSWTGIYTGTLWKTESAR